MSTLIHHRVREAQKGENPTVICEMPSGWAVIGDQQFIRGYCLLLADPVVPNLNILTGAARSQFLVDMAIIGDALLEVTDSFCINYEILGNTEPALHAPIFPRYMSEPDEPRSIPFWMGFTREEYNSRPLNLERDKELMEKNRCRYSEEVMMLRLVKSIR